jgi:hypothetical protein
MPSAAAQLQTSGRERFNGSNVTVRDRILLISLWLSVVALTTWVGGTLYQMLVIVPLWSASPPESVRAFFQGTEWNRTIFNFFGPSFIAARNVPVLAALIAGWHLPQHRRALGDVPVAVEN